MQENVFDSRSEFCCPSAQALKTALLAASAALPSSTVIGPILPVAVAGPRAVLAKRPALQPPCTTAQPLKRNKSGPSRLRQELQGLQADSAMNACFASCTHATQRPVAVSHLPVQNEQPAPRRVLPQQMKSTAEDSRLHQMGRTVSDDRLDLTQTEKGCVAGQRIEPAVSRGSQFTRASSSNSDLPTQPNKEESSQRRASNSCLHRQTVDAAESEPTSAEGSDTGSELGSGGVEPGKVLMEFGSAGDLWWNDFITAKEEMLTDVLQVGFYSVMVYIQGYSLST